MKTWFGWFWHISYQHISVVSTCHVCSVVDRTTFSLELCNLVVFLCRARWTALLLKCDTNKAELPQWHTDQLISPILKSFMLELIIWPNKIQKFWKMTSLIFWAQFENWNWRSLTVAQYCTSGANYSNTNWENMEWRRSDRSLSSRPSQLLHSFIKSHLTGNIFSWIPVP